MFRKIVSAVIFVPLAAVIIIFAVSNRQSVAVVFDPFSTTSPAYAVTLPLFVLIVVLIILGVLIGGTGAWFGQARWRRAAPRLEADSDSAGRRREPRRLDADVRSLHQELDAIRRRFTPEAPRAPDPAPYTVIPPPLP